MCEALQKFVNWWFVAYKIHGWVCCMFQELCVAETCVKWVCIIPLGVKVSR